MAASNSCRLYLISPPAIDLISFRRQLQAAFSGGDVASFQLRLKNATDAEILEAAHLLIPICHEHGAAFILNDRADLAVQCNADGVHIGQEDGSIKQARSIVGSQRIIGVSCHDSRHLAMEAGEQGADYVAFGAFYPTTSKSPQALARWGIPDPDILNWWQTYMTLPCVAIGGINAGNCGSLVKAGADFIAVIQAVWNHKSGASQAVWELNDAMSGSNGRKDD